MWWQRTEMVQGKVEKVHQSGSREVKIKSGLISSHWWGKKFPAAQESPHSPFLHDHTISSYVLTVGCGVQATNGTLDLVRGALPWPSPGSSS